MKRVRVVPLGLGWLAAGMLLSLGRTADAATAPKPGQKGYAACVAACLDTLMAHGTDRYGPRHAPILVSILDVNTRQCPSNPAALDETWRVTRRGRRNPAGANLLTDQPTLKTMYALSRISGDDRYARFADNYIDWYLKNLVDDNGLFWWGWHRHYDVFLDARQGHQGNPHEIHAIHDIAWDRMWAVNSNAVRREIEAIWEWHVIDKKTGEINRHADGRRGCDFAMSAGAYARAFAFQNRQTRAAVWLDRARLLADYYWVRRNPETGLFADRPNAGTDRFDGAHFLTSDTGLFCHALLKCFELTGDRRFKDQAVVYLKAYRKFGYDSATGNFWGSLRLDGTPVPGPRIQDGYAAYEPRGHLDFWQPYAAGYEHPLPNAQVYAYASQLSNDPVMLATAKLLAQSLSANLPPRKVRHNTWYQGYADAFAPQGAYAAHYGQAISFLVHLFVLTGDQQFLIPARSLADETIEKLYHQGLFRGHPAKPYYEAMDGVGYLLYALLELDQLLQQPEDAVARKAIRIGQGSTQIPMALDNW